MKAAVRVAEWADQKAVLTASQLAVRKAGNWACPWAAWKAFQRAA